MITICFDFGNTSCKAAVFHDRDIIEAVTLSESIADDVSALIQKHKPNRSILTSVINHDPQIETLLNEKTSFHLLTAGSKLNFSLAVGKPETTGTDRIAIIAAAIDCYPNKNNLIISLGSCITYNFVNQYGQFLGGAISPGLEMRFKSMNDYTAKLPKVSAEWNTPLIGYDTKTNIQSGVVHGIINEIEGFINDYAERYDNFNVVLTGGNSPYFAVQLKKRIFADLNFLFKGLYALQQINQPNN
jgi:type III pantothenate kinase